MTNNLSSVAWTPEEIAFVLKAASDAPARQSKASVARDIAAQMGRTAKSVEQKLLTLTMSDEVRERRAKSERERYAKRVENCNPYLTEIIYRPTDEMIAERNNRLAAGPRDLTGALCGDPPRGFSALERRA